MKLYPLTYKEGVFYLELFNRNALWEFTYRKYYYPIALRIAYKEWLRDLFREKRKTEHFVKKRLKLSLKSRIRNSRIRKRKKKKRFRRLPPYKKAYKEIRKKYLTRTTMFMLNKRRYYLFKYLRYKILKIWVKNRFWDWFEYCLEKGYIRPTRYLHLGGTRYLPLVTTHQLRAMRKVKKKINVHTTEEQIRKYFAWLMCTWYEEDMFYENT